MEDKFDTILKEIGSNESVSVTTNPRTESNGIQSIQPSGSENNKSIAVRASDNENSESEDKNYPPKASK